MLTIWGRRHSHNVRKVTWFAEELGLAYQRNDVGGAFGMDAQYLEKNPNALIPTIEDDGMVLWESNAILRYLASRYGSERYWPADPQKRAVADRWMDWQLTYGRAQLDAFVQLVRHAPEAQDHDVIARSVAASTRLMLILNRYLGETPWLSGDAFGVGDVPMGVYAYTYFTLDIERPDGLTHVEDWYRRLRARDAYAREVMLPLQ